VLDLYEALRSVIGVLDDAGIPYALAGGLAVSIYTAPRATEDVDLALDARDLDRAQTALATLGLRPAGRATPVASGRLEIQRLTRIDGVGLLVLDLLVARDPDLAAALRERTAMLMEGRTIWVVTIGTLRMLKRLRGSAQDRADLEALGPE
jgi:hypothetical protein